MSTTEVLLNTFNSSSAPLSTKNRIYSGAVQRSVLSMISAEKSHTLQNTVPSIMHTSRLEKPIFTLPTSNSIIERPTVRMTNVMRATSRLLFDLKYFSAAGEDAPYKAQQDGEHDFQQRLNEDARHVRYGRS